MSSPVVTWTGVTMDSVHACLRKIIYGVGATEEEDAAIKEKADKYIIPMLHNYFNPITPDSDDTYVEYQIESDDALGKDALAYDAAVSQVCVADIALRFIGPNAEGVAKYFHLLTTRQDTSNIWFTECYAQLLPYVSPILSTCIDYYGSTAAWGWDVRFRLQYTLVLPLGQQKLENVTLASGSVS